MCCVSSWHWGFFASKLAICEESWSSWLPILREDHNQLRREHRYKACEKHSSFGDPKSRLDLNLVVTQLLGIKKVRKTFQLRITGNFSLCFLNRVPKFLTVLFLFSFVLLLPFCDLFPLFFSYLGVFLWLQRRKKSLVNVLLSMKISQCSVEIYFQLLSSLSACSESLNVLTSVGWISVLF